MARPKKHTKPAKLNLSLEEAVKRIADKNAFSLGKSISDYVTELIVRDRRRVEQRKLRERAVARAAAQEKETRRAGKVVQRRAA